MKPIPREVVKDYEQNNSNINFGLNEELGHNLLDGIDRRNRDYFFRKYSQEVQYGNQ